MLALIPWWFASLIANICIAAIEYFNHTSPYGSWVETLARRTLGPIIIAQWALYASFNGAPHWLMAWAVFTMGNAGTRLIAVHLTGQPIGSWPHVLLGTAVMILGSLVLKEGLS